MTMQARRNSAVRELISEGRQLTVVVGKQVNPQLGRLDLTITSVAVLELLQEGPATVPDLARRLLMSRQATQRFVDDLADSGRVRRVDNPRHVRSPLYVLTDAGRAAIEGAGQVEARFMDELALDLPVADLEQAAASLARLREAVLQRRQP